MRARESAVDAADRIRRLLIFCVVAPVAILTIAAAPERDSVFTTLGTNAGPIPDPRRGEPSNLLRADGQTILIDAGDGAADRLGRENVPLGAIEAVFISHLHFDHTGGLFAFLSQRYQGMAPRPVTIYGPRGMRRTVDGLMAAMGPMTDPGSNIRERSPIAPDEAVKVIELADGATVTLGQIAVSVARNTHYENGLGAGGNADTASLSYRFDMPDRSIVYTGDTGPSARVEELARGADLMVAEIMDPEEAVASLRRRRPDLPESSLAQVEAHHRQQHLAPREAGLMARRSGVRALVLTHIGISDAGLPKAERAVRAAFPGPVTFAKDRQSFR